MDEAVGDRRGGRGVVKELAPLLEGEIGSDDGGGALVAAIEDLVEEVGAASVEGEVAELIDEEELVCGPEGEATVKAVAGLRRDEIVDEVRSGGEADAAATEAGELADGVGEVGLADAGGAEEDDVGFLVEEFERGGLGDDVTVDGLGRSRAS